MRLHEMQVRVAPVLRGAITGASSATVTQVVPSSVGVATMIIPGSDRAKVFSDNDQLLLLLLQRRNRVIGARLTSLSSCVSAGDSCRVSAGWTSPSGLGHNPGTPHDYDVPCLCPTLWLGLSGKHESGTEAKHSAACKHTVRRQCLGDEGSICWPVVPVISSSVLALSGAVIVTSLPSELVSSPAVVLIIAVTHLGQWSNNLHTPNVRVVLYRT